MPLSLVAAERSTAATTKKGMSCSCGEEGSCRAKDAKKQGESAPAKALYPDPNDLESKLW